MNNTNDNRLQVLCVTMNQEDFSLVEKMNLKSDAIIANQTNNTSLEEKKYVWGTVKMISTQTKGVGINRNIAFHYATDEILLLSDDDMQYSDSYVEDILHEFDEHPNADVFIFNILSTNTIRKQKQNCKTRKITFMSRLPYGAPRIAIRKDVWQKSNIWFSSLFGGGAKYTNGEDSIFLKDILKKKLKVYVSNKCIGKINMDNSSWFKGANEEFFFNKGAFCAAVYPNTIYLRMLYFAFRVKSSLCFFEKIHYFRKGSKAYIKGEKYEK